MNHKGQEYFWCGELSLQRSPRAPVEGWDLGTGVALLRRGLAPPPHASLFSRTETSPK